MADAGWYPDPQHPGFVAFWDGVAWTGQTQPAAPFVATHTAPPPVPVAPPVVHVPRRRRIGLVAGAAVLVLAAGGLTAFELTTDDGPTLTYHGKGIKDADGTLRAAEAAVARSVTARHGAKAATSRCYYSVPTKPAKGSAATDVDSTVFCGPVLFLDGNVAAEYLRLPLSDASTDGPAQLTAAQPTSYAAPIARPTASTLERPDGLSAPRGAGGLAVPTPPPASSALLTTVPDLGSSVRTPSALTGARMVGASTGIEVTAAGYVAQVGTGDAARSAAKGCRLLAFQYSSVYGALRNGASIAPQLVTTVGGRTTRRAVPAAVDDDSWVVASVPTGATTVLSLTDGRLTQTLSLPAGKPGATNLRVLARVNAVSDTVKNLKVSIQFSDALGSATSKTSVQVLGGHLGYWVYLNQKIHASRADEAMLIVDVSYLDPQEHKRYGIPPGLVTLTLRNGRVLKAHNLASDPDKILLGFYDVPADLTQATVTLSGTTESHGLRYTLPKAVSVPIAFAAG